MPTPTRPDNRDDAQPDGSDAAAGAKANARPAGIVGGHTVQDWEQPAPKARALDKSKAVDEASPEVQALYLRPIVRAPVPAAPAVVAVAPPVADATSDPIDIGTQILAAQTGALVDAITRGFANELARSLRPSVEATVRALLPMLLTLGNVPGVDGPDTLASDQADVAATRDDAEVPA
jgi:hypothetical protein